MVEKGKKRRRGKGERGKKGKRETRGRSRKRLNQRMRGKWAEIRLPLSRVFQVYEARLRSSGQAVAVKVQRPGVKAAIALDVFILRLLAGYAKKVAKVNTDLQVRGQKGLHRGFGRNVGGRI